MPFKISETKKEHTIPSFATCLVKSLMATDLEVGDIKPWTIISEDPHLNCMRLSFCRIHIFGHLQFW